MDTRIFDSIPLEAKRAIIQQQLIDPIKGTLYRLDIQRRAAEITDDKAALEAVMSDAKRLAAQLAVYERELAEVK